MGDRLLIQDLSLEMIPGGGFWILYRPAGPRHGRGPAQHHCPIYVGSMMVRTTLLHMIPDCVLRITFHHGLELYPKVKVLGEAEPARIKDVRTTVSVRIQS